MKLTAFIVLSVCLQVSARNGLAQQTITLSERNAALETVLQKIHDQTGYEYFFKSEDAKNVRVTIYVKNTPVDEVLPIFFQGKDFTYEIVNKIIVVKKRESLKNGIAQISDTSNPPEIVGTVKSQAGDPLGGATIFIKKLKKSGVTNNLGEFILKDIPNGVYEVEISYIGYDKYITSITVVNNEAKLLVEMKQSQNNLDETVVKGYYNTTKRLNTGDVSTIKAEDISKQPVNNYLEALEGRVPGLYIVQNTGTPGSSFTVNLHGTNSIANGNNPLYIIDGVPFPSTSINNSSPGSLVTNFGNPLNFINPSDIESIDILKDADATAIYGSRGSNGVILITTKKSTSNKTSVDINAYAGIGKTSKFMHLLNTSQYLNMRHEAFANDGAMPGSTDYDLNGKWDTARYTNWQKSLLGGTDNIADIQMSISGGNNNTKFLFGGGYHRETTVFPGNFADQKASFHFNLNHTSSDKKFKANISASYLDDNNNLLGTDLLNKAITLPPDAPKAYDSLGNLNWANSTWVNPLSYIKQKYKYIGDNLVANLSMSYEILNGLLVKSNFGYTNITIGEKQANPLSSMNPATAPLSNTLFDNSSLKTWIIEPQVEYQKSFNTNKVGLLIGSTFQGNQQQELSQIGIGFANDALIENITAANTQLNLSNVQSLYHYSSLFGRINFSNNDKYLLNITARRDGSSRFGPGKQFGNFGAVGAAWIISKEQFFQPFTGFLSFVKLRASYGTTGNDQIPDYGYLSTYSVYSYQYQGNATLYPTRLLNPGFSWEINKKLEGGIELGMLGDRVLVIANYFRNRSSNQLVGYSLPPTTGFSTIQYNLGATIQNTGFDLQINSKNIIGKYFTWSSYLTLSVPRNKLIAYPNLAGSSYSHRYIVGRSLQTAMAYKYLGVDPTTGVYSFQDVDKDGKISNPNDLQPSKLVSQFYYGGFGNQFNYRGIQLDFLIQFVKQNGRNYLYSSGLAIPGMLGNQPNYVLGRWQKDGDKTDVQKFTHLGNTSAGMAWTSTHAYGSNTIGDASFMRLKNVSVSYTLPKSLFGSKTNFDCKVYVQGQNLITLTKYQGLDPETQTLSYVPPLRMFTGGIKLSF